MSFLSSQSLEKRLNELISDGADTTRIDCNSIQLRMGHEYYVSPQNSSESKERKISPLANGGAFVVPPGQFAFLITEELINCPPDMMAFISLRSTIKNRGLVNVSGFHVDPGYKGRLTFSVFNAGPSVVHIRRGEPIFLIWFASLDYASEKRYLGSEKTEISSSIVNNVSGQVTSLSSLDERLRVVEASNTVFRATVAMFISIIIVIAGKYVIDSVRTTQVTATHDAATGRK